MSCSSLKKISDGHRSSPRATIAAVGDINGYNVPDTQSPFAGVETILSGSDIFLFNAESVFTDRFLTTCRRLPKQSTFVSSSRLLEYVSPGKLTVASLANNHSLDCGDEGLSETVTALHSRRVYALGAGMNSEEACRPLTIVLNGLRLTLLPYFVTDADDFLAGTRKPGAASLENCNGYAQIAKSREQGEFVVVIMHAHLPYSPRYSWADRPHRKLIAVIHNILDAGADLIIGSGPHVPQAVMTRDNKVALLSLGNFLFHPDYRMRDDARNALLAKVAIGEGGFEVSLIPIRLDGSGKPTLPSPREALSLLQNIEELSREFGTRLTMSNGAARVEVARETRFAHSPVP